MHLSKKNRQVFVTPVTLTTLGIMLTGAIWAAFDSGKLQFNHPSVDDFPVWGVDVSHHQGDIDWPHLKRAHPSISFAYIKATEGGDWKDKSFFRNWRDAKDNGLAVGAYHFFTLCRSAEAQAENFLDTLSRTTSTESLPPAVDLEFGGNCARRPSVVEFHTELRRFLDLLEKRTGRKPILYVTSEFRAHYLQHKFREYKLWVRNIFHQPDETDTAWAFWQYHNRGRLSGVQGPIDLNVFRGGGKDLSRWIAPPRTHQPPFQYTIQKEPRNIR